MMETGGISPADIAAVVDNDRGNNGWDGSSAWVLIILFALIFGWGGNGFGGNRSTGDAVTQAELCNSMNFNDLQNAVGRLSDNLAGVNTNLNNAICSLGYENLQNFNSTQNLINNGFNNVVNQINQCCCDTQRQIDAVNYNNAMNTASINKTTTEQTQKILDVLCGNRMTDMQNQINALQLQSALSGVVRYPNGLTYNAGSSPFCNCGCGSCNI